MIHKLKCWPHEFDALFSGEKTFEVRSNRDRDFGVGDILVLQKWDPAAKCGAGVGAYIDEDGFPTVQEAGFEIRRKAIYILHGGRFGLPPGMCVMALEVV